ncbi:hypothetical protein ACEWY4_004899 [Coilia grayii]|uniref:Uracil-DNA glycosylase n=1 Tax=Coilia grayii TaxID=363190 RepID=A0ABD1KMZ1_9TELE
MSALTPDQLALIERKRQDAVRRLAARHVCVSVGESWRREIGAEFSKPYFTKLASFIALERERFTVYPPPELVFAWTRMCAVEEVKVVILGQDPYHHPGQAHGLCFSVPRPSPPPPSLENIYAELASDVKDFKHPGHGDLTGWAKQGVLLMNAVLTVRANEPSSHGGRGWETFTDAVVHALSSRLRDVVFLLWGAHAHRKGSIIDRRHHHVLQTSHPSPYSADRGFLGCRHFSKTNELLSRAGKAPVDWTAL